MDRLKEREIMVGNAKKTIDELGLGDGSNLVTKSQALFDECRNNPDYITDTLEFSDTTMFMIEKRVNADDVDEVISTQLLKLLDTSGVCISRRMADKEVTESHIVNIATSLNIGVKLHNLARTYWFIEQVTPTEKPKSNRVRLMEIVNSMEPCECREIPDDLNISLSTLRVYCSELRVSLLDQKILYKPLEGAPKPKSTQKWRSKNKNVFFEFINTIEAGESKKLPESLLGVPYGTLRNYCSEFNVSLRGDEVLK